MATAQQLAALAEFVEGLATTDDIQAELDGVNSRHDVARQQIAIALQVARDPQYTDAERITLIIETLGPQE